MFSLQEQKAKLTNVNPRSELHGTDHRMAADLSIEIKVSNDVLSEFHPSLKFSLYQKPTDAQADLINDPTYLPELKFPLMGPIKWDYKGAGYETTVHYGVSGRDNIILLECEVDSFRFECQDGGTTVVKFRVITHPTPMEIGRLCEMIQQEISISLTPPSEEDLLKRELAAQQEE